MDVGSIVYGFGNATDGGNGSIPVVALTTGPPIEPVNPLRVFNQSYDPIHGYLSLITCILGVTLNIANIYILTRRGMIGSPTNTLLTALSVADALTCATYLPFALTFFIIKDMNHGIGHEWTVALYGITSMNLVIMFHAAAMWLTVALATFRYMLVRHLPCTDGGPSQRCSKITVAAITLVAILTSLPNFLCYSVGETLDASGNTTVSMKLTDICKAHDRLLQKIGFFVLGGLIKTGACLLLLLFSCFILYALTRAQKHHDKVHYKPAPSGTGCSPTGSAPASQRRRHMTTVTRMLVSVVLIFVVTDLPQGILVLLCFSSEKFFQNVYGELGDFMDILVLFNSTINFLFYATMSRQYRTTFKDHILRRILSLVRRSRRRKREDETLTLPLNQTENTPMTMVTMASTNAGSQATASQHNREEITSNNGRISE